MYIFNVFDFRLFSYTIFFGWKFVINLNIHLTAKLNGYYTRSTNLKVQSGCLFFPDIAPKPDLVLFKELHIEREYSSALKPSIKHIFFWPVLGYAYK